MCIRRIKDSFYWLNFIGHFLGGVVNERHSESKLIYALNTFPKYASTTKNRTKLCESGRFSNHMLTLTLEKGITPSQRKYCAASMLCQPSLSPIVEFTIILFLFTILKNSSALIVFHPRGYMTILCETEENSDCAFIVSRDHYARTVIN